MNILDFIKKHSKYNPTDHADWENDWNSLLKKSKENNSLVLCFHTLLEEGYSFEHIKKIIDYDPIGKKEIFEDENTFKWACAFGNRYLIIYLNDKVKTHNIAGAITATFLQYRLDNLQTLELLGYEKDIYTEPNFCQAVSRANQAGCSLNIVEFFCSNFDKFPKLSNYFWQELKKQDWVDKMLLEYPKTFELFLSMNLDSFKTKVVKQAENIASYALRDGSLQIVDKVMNSELKDDFIKEYNKKKKSIIKDNLSLDKNTATQEMILKYPELLNYDDIKLWHMNENSYTIKEFIEKYRTIPFKEIKTAFVELSKLSYLYNQLEIFYPSFNYEKLKLQDIVKILNNKYDEEKYNKISYDFESDYMIFARKTLIQHKDFNHYKEEVRDVIQDSKMFDLLYKEQIKKNLENKLAGVKPSEKKMKI